MKPQLELRQRVELIKVPLEFIAEEFYPINKFEVVKSLREIIEASQRQNQTAYCLLELENMLRTYPLAEVCAFKAMFELAVYKPENALETLRLGVRARAEPTELLRDVEKNICVFLKERPQIRINKPRNDRFSKKYQIDENVMLCCNSLCEIYALKRGASEKQVLELGWRREEPPNEESDTPNNAKPRNFGENIEKEFSANEPPASAQIDSEVAKESGERLDENEDGEITDLPQTRQFRKSGQTRKKSHPTLERAKWVYSRAEIQAKYAIAAEKARTCRTSSPWRDSRPVCCNYESVFSEDKPSYLSSAIE